MKATLNKMLTAGLAIIAVTLLTSFGPARAHCIGKPGHNETPGHSCDGDGDGGGGGLLKHTGSFDPSRPGISGDGQDYANGGKGESKITHISDSIGWRLDTAKSGLEGGVRKVMLDLPGCTAGAVSIDVDMRLEQGVVALGGMLPGDSASVGVFAIMPPSLAGGLNVSCGPEAGASLTQYVLVIGELNPNGVWNCPTPLADTTGVTITRASQHWAFATSGSTDDSNACLLEITDGDFQNPAEVWPEGRVDFALDVCDLEVSDPQGDCPPLF